METMIDIMPPISFNTIFQLSFTNSYSPYEIDSFKCINIFSPIFIKFFDIFWRMIFKCVEVGWKVFKIKICANMFQSSKFQHSLRRSQCTCTANILQSRKGILNLIVEIDSGTSLFSFIFLTIVELFYKRKRYKLCAVCDYIQTTIYFTGV